VRVLVATSHDADDRKTRAAVRSLAAAGMAVTLLCDHERCPVAGERGVAASRRTPDPWDAARWTEHLLRLLREDPHDALLPLDDGTTRAASTHRSRLRDAVALAAPDVLSLDRAHDKAGVRETALRLGVPAPKTRLVANAKDLGPAALALGFPVVVKPRRGSGGLGVSVCRDPEALRAAWERRPPLRLPHVDTSELLVQEFVPGEVHDVGALVANGRVRASLTQRRLRMDPPEGGPGVAVETTDEPGLAHLAARLLGELDWHGPAQVEFRRDERDGAFRLLEVNVRFWGTLGLATTAGLDLPRLAVELALRGDLPETPRPPAGVRADLPLEAPAPVAPRGSC
jgi:predicted ATP-grasp superfamily ATP-dependent carboligase